VESQRQAGVAARLEVAARLLDRERSLLDEDVRRLRELGRFRQDLCDRKVHVGVGVRELGRHGVRAEPGWHAAGRGDRFQRRKLGFLVEPVARLTLERRRPGPEHPVAVALDGSAEILGGAGACGADGREDPAARRVQLLVARAAGPQGELLHAVAEEARMGVAVDEPGDRAAASPVELLDVAAELEPAELAHAPRRCDPARVAEHEGVLEHLHVSKRAATDRRLGVRRRGRELREVADEEPVRSRLAGRHSRAGSRRPCSSAAASASS
jgi:hypothetical protein